MFSQRQIDFVSLKCLSEDQIKAQSSRVVISVKASHSVISVTMSETLLEVVVNGVRLFGTKTSNETVALLKNIVGENGFSCSNHHDILLVNTPDDQIEFEILTCLIYHQFLFSKDHEIPLKPYFFETLKDEQSRLGWHDDCKDCSKILKIDPFKRANIIHALMFDRCSTLFQEFCIEIGNFIDSQYLVLMKNFETLDKGKVKERILAKNEGITVEILDFHFKVLSDIFEQVKVPDESSRFNCKNFQIYLETMKLMATWINAKELQKCIDFFLFPFKFPLFVSTNERFNESFNERFNERFNSEKIREAKAEWGKMTYHWSHSVDAPEIITGTYDDFPNKYDHDCHGTIPFELQNRVVLNPCEFNKDKFQDAINRTQLTHLAKINDEKREIILFFTNEFAAEIFFNICLLHGLLPSLKTMHVPHLKNPDQSWFDQCVNDEVGQQLNFGIEGVWTVDLIVCVSN